jgi:hypothetical protein
VIGRRHRLWVCGVIVSVLVAALPALPATAATPVRFGAKLFTGSDGQPTPAERCSQHGEIPSDKPCTWVMVVGYQNASRTRAPRNGTIRRVRLVSCVAGSFTVQVARRRSGTQRFKVVKSPAFISYQADNRATCGGPGEDDFRIQSFSVNFTVQTGDYIAVKAKRVGFMRSSSSGDTYLFEPPLGNSYRSRDTSTGNMLIQYQYAS